MPPTPVATARAAGGCCSPLPTRRRRAGAFTTRSACVAPGFRALRSMGSPAARFYAVGGVARHPVGINADCLGAQHRGARSHYHHRARRWRRALFGGAIASDRCAFTTRACGRLRPSAFRLWLLCAPTQGAIIIGDTAGRVRGGWWGVRSGRSHHPAVYPLKCSPRVATAPPAPPRGGVQRTAAASQLRARVVPPLFAANLFHSTPGHSAGKRKRIKKRKGGRTAKAVQASPFINR